MSTITSVALVTFGVVIGILSSTLYSRTSLGDNATPAARLSQGILSSGDAPPKAGDVGAVEWGRSATGAAPIWLASRDVRGMPAPPCSIARAFGVRDPFACQRRTLAVPTRCIIGRHEDHWNFFATLLNSTREPFALLRYVDGERGIMEGSEVINFEDNWSWKGSASTLAAALFAGLRGHYGEPVFYAFASPLDDPFGLEWYLEHTEATCAQLTYANLWVNALYPRTKELLLDLLERQPGRIVVAANGAGLADFDLCPERGGPLLACVPLPDGAARLWENATQRAQVLESYLSRARAVPRGTLFITCGGPLSKPLIAAAWRANPENSYVDMGSTMDEIIKKRVTRLYMDPSTPYFSQIDPQWYCGRGARANGRCQMDPWDE